MNQVPISLVFEDALSEFVMIKLLHQFPKFYVGNSYSEGGFGYIKKNIRGFNEAAKSHPYFILADLDRVDCAPTLINSWMKERAHENLIFRIAVREIEAWLLADIDGFSSYTGISKVNFFNDPEKLADPKLALLQIIRKCRKRDIREDILPKDEYARIGPNYNERLAEFVIKYWNIKRAAKYSDSLRRAIKHLSAFKLTKD
jgi:hypothetical protein